jgi:hypothetical protein
MDYFFYGTLMDADVLGAVVGRAISPARLRPAVLAGYRRVYAKGASYPVLVPGGAEDLVEGRLFKDATAAEARRLRRYEGGHYGEATLKVTVTGEGSVEARTFLPRPGVAATAEPWEFRPWQRRHKRAYMRGFKDSMGDSAPA